MNVKIALALIGASLFLLDLLFLALSRKFNLSCFLVFQQEINNVLKGALEQIRVEEQQTRMSPVNRR